LLNATTSGPIPPYLAWLTAALLGVRVTVLPGGTHLPHLTHPAEVAKILAAQCRNAKQ
jgi:pimeloyl-ACP methyl ester carboxylesterase